MRKSRWFLPAAIVTLAFGLGHSGCYSSGTPGGFGAGGAPATSPIDAGGSASGNDDAGSEDSGADATTVPEGCGDSRDCAVGEVCDPTSHRCVGCITQADCTATTQRCANYQCVDIVGCATDKVCTPIGQICDTTNGYCVDCLDQSNCPAGQGRRSSSADGPFPIR